MPINMTLAAISVPEDPPDGAVVARLGAEDATGGSGFTYTLAEDPSGKFDVVGNEVRVKAGASIDYETVPSYDLTVTRPPIPRG